MELKVGMELELIKDLDCGVRVIEKGEVFRVQHISVNSVSKVSIINDRIGVGVFELEEIKEYFKEYKEEIKVDEDVRKVIYSDKVTVVILNSGIKGIAKCLEEDEYDKKTGYRIAYLKAKVKEMNKELKSY